MRFSIILPRDGNIFILVSVGFLALLTGCAPLDHSQSDAVLRGSGKYELFATPEIPVVTEPSACGAQVLAAVIAHYDPQSPDVSATLQQIFRELPPYVASERGMTPVEILVTARKHGLTAIIQRGQWDDFLKSKSDIRQTAIVMLDVGREFPTLISRIPLGQAAMHWSIVSGYALDGSALLLAAPDQRHHVIKKSEFLRRWEKSDNCLIMVEAGW